MPYLVRLLHFLIAALLITSVGYAQFTDDFSDGDFTANPEWSGDDALFTVDAGQLRSNTGSLTTATTYYLSTPSTLAANAQWEFFLNLKFATSGANYVDIYLMSDVQSLSTPANGYFVRIGETADHVTLSKMSGGGASLLIASPDGIVNSSSDNPFHIKVTRNASDLWTLQYIDGNTGSYLTAGTATDGSITSSAFFGVRITQSTAASVVNNHFFDDFYVGPIIQDTAPPIIVSATVTDDQHVDLLFNEPVEQTSAEALSNYALGPSNGIASAALNGTNPSLVHLTLASPMANGTTYTITVNGVQDLSGNVLVNGTQDFTYAVIGTAQPGDVIMNELMADPTPVVGLPDAEFVELFNTTTDQTFDLTGWKIFAGTSNGTLPSIQLPPGGYLILSGTSNAPLFSGFGTSIGVPSFPALVNGGDAMVLQNASGTIIDAVTYDISWYNDAAKSSGGWTLERMDPFTPCSSVNNWTASIASIGGTPGAQNSVFAILDDTTPPTIAQVFVVDSVTVDVLFSEIMDQGTLLSGDYSIEPASGITNVSVIAPDRVRITLATELVAGELQTITITDVRDCPGNLIAGGNTATFALPEIIEAGDVVINEVLYDPRGSGSDFVELYNRSQKVVSIAGLKLANGTGSSVLITSEAYLLLPGQYVAVASNTVDVLANYPLGRADRMLQASLPSYVNGSGTVVFQAANGDTLDLFNYSDDLQFALLKSVDGVSLERVDPDRPTSDNSNWHSAAAAVNFATPGYQNSQYAPAPEAKGTITIDPAIFSPDNDGHQDLLTITYEFDEPGFVGTIKVFDLAGRDIRTLMNNELLGTSGSLSWDGLMDGNELARIGPYVIYMEAYDLAGNVEKFRKSVVLAHRL
ncbi:MAG: lamin tail domain-containing protein [Flavobacteriales bacterium]|nr:lamin tail domain-containing protein [Flavobacteriales bacterium]